MPKPQPYCLDVNPIARFAYPSAFPHRLNDYRWYRNINLLSIAYACRPQLRTRLTQSRRAFLGNLSRSVDGILTIFRYSHRHPTSKRSTCPYDHASTPLERSPTIVQRTIHSFGNMFSPGTFSAQCHSTSELRRTIK